MFSYLSIMVFRFTIVSILPGCYEVSQKNEPNLDLIEVAGT